MDTQHLSCDYAVNVCISVSLLIPEVYVVEQPETAICMC
jgi:hypothetical protein